MLPLALHHQVDQVHTGFERTHHAFRRLVEHVVGCMIEEVAFELEVDNEVHMSPVAHRREGPGVCQVLEWPAFSSAYQNLPRSIQCDLARKALLEWSKPDLEVSNDLLLILAMNANAAAPWHERGIVLHVRHDREKLVSRVGKRLFVLVTWHMLLP